MDLPSRRPILSGCDAHPKRTAMNPSTKTTSILQRLPVILAVTAASYGLPAQAHSQRATVAPATSQTGASHHAPAATPRR